MNFLHHVRLLYRLHVRLVASMHARFMRRRAKARKFLAMRVDKAPRFDERSTIDRFRRESGQR